MICSQAAPITLSTRTSVSDGKKPNLESANGISADGSIIVGIGINPDENTEAWLADLSIPLPPALWMGILLSISDATTSSTSTGYSLPSLILIRTIPIWNKEREGRKKPDCLVRATNWRIEMINTIPLPQTPHSQGHSTCPRGVKFPFSGTPKGMSARSEVDNAAKPHVKC